MSGESGVVKDKVLIITLSILLVVIMGLVTVNIVVMKSRQNQKLAVITEGERHSALLELGRETSEVKQDMTEMLEAEDVNFDAINNMVDNEIDQAISSGGALYIISLLESRTDAYVAKGYKREALDALIQSEKTGRIKIAKADRHRIYLRAYALAEELGEEEAMKMFQNLLKETEEAYIEDYNATQQSAEKANENMGGF